MCALNCSLSRLSAALSSEAIAVLPTVLSIKDGNSRLSQELRNLIGEDNFADGTPNDRNIPRFGSPVSTCAIIEDCTESLDHLFSPQVTHNPSAVVFGQEFLEP